MIADNVFSVDSVTIGLNDLGLILVTGYSHDEGGSNGSGKSSVCTKSLIWGLFGTTTDGVRADDVINRHSGKKKALVRICFTDSNNDVYIITRTRNPNKLVLTDGEGNDLSCRLGVGTQDRIEKLLGFDYKTFVQSSFFGQGNVMSFPELTTSEQQGILENILPIEELQDWLKGTKRAKEKLVSELKEINTEYAKHDSALSVYKANLDEQKVKSKAWEENKTRELAKAEHNLAVAIQRKEERADILKGYEKELEQLGPPRNVEPLQHRIKEIDAGIDKWFSVREEALKSKTSWSGRLGSLRAEKTSLRHGLCHACNQALPNLSQAREENSKHLAEAEKNLGEADKAYDNTLEIINGAIAERDNLEVEIKGEEAKEKQREIIRGQASILSETICKVDVQMSQEGVDRWKNYTNPHTSTIEQAELGIERNEAKIVKINTRRANLETELSAVQVWEGAFSKDIRTLLFDKICVFLNDKVRYHLFKLNNSQLRAEFSTLKAMKSGKTKDEFSLKCWSEHGGESFASLSGGEKQIVSFAVGLSLAELAETQVRHSSNLLILDEPFLYLDDKNCENVVQYLMRELMKKKSTIFLISNEDHLKALVPNRIHVTKTSGLTSATGKGVLANEG
jgi:DNA repair exonuclease SbcCD ATPase subunit